VAGNLKIIWLAKPEEKYGGLWWQLTCLITLQTRKIIVNTADMGQIYNLGVLLMIKC